MYAVTSIVLVRRTRATLRSAEFGFFGVVVYTRVQTPRRCGAATRFLRPLPDFRPGVASFLVFGFRPLRTSWEVVGIRRERLAGALACAGRSRGRGWPCGGRTRAVLRTSPVEGRGGRRCARGSRVGPDRRSDALEPGLGPHHDGAPGEQHHGRRRRVGRDGAPVRQGRN